MTIDDMVMGIDIPDDVEMVELGVDEHAVYLIDTKTDEIIEIFTLH